MELDKKVSGASTVREEAIEACRALFNGSSKLSYFERRGIVAETLKRAGVGYETGTFTYPCVRKSGGLLAIHCKSQGRDESGKRRQWWKGYADDLPPKGHGKRPDEPAKVIPFGLETLGNLEPGSPVVLCCGEEDALSLRQMGYTALSQPGAGLLEPVYAREFAGFEVVVFYDAGEEREARKDALKLLEARAREVRIIEWPAAAENGADVNGRLVEDPEGFAEWATRMIANAKALSSVGADHPKRDGQLDMYFTPLPNLTDPPWPKLDDRAFHGLPGEIVREMEPHSEADPVALLGSLLCACGNAIGRGAHFRVGADVHHLKLFVAFVGRSSKARKGMSWGFVSGEMEQVDPTWAQDRVKSGLSSGEGLIHFVRDRVEGEDKRGELVVHDEGVEDKRLLVVEPELAGLLKTMSREDNTVSPVLRQPWDGAPLQTLTKNSPAKATNSHISVIGHITSDELLRDLRQTEAANGFANRFLWLLVKRSKVLPFGGSGIEWTQPL